MKKPDKKYAMIMVCKSCRKELPIDQEKSTAKDQYYKERCECGSRGEWKFSG